MQKLQNKKVEGKTSENDSIDFHLEIIKKIDKIIEEHEKKTIDDSEVEHQIHHVQEDIPAEIRQPLNKRIELSDVNIEKKPEAILPNKVNIPDEFKIELPITNNPYFKFITTLDSIDDMLRIPDKNNERVEIIDISSLMVNESASRVKKIEIINTGKLKDKKFDDTFNKTMQQANKNDAKSRMYYIRSGKEEKNSYIPVDFDDRLKKLKEKEEQIKEEESEKLTKEELKKAKIEERKKRKEEKKKQKEAQKAEKKKDKKEEDESNNKPKEEPTLLDEDIKKILLITDDLLGNLPDNIIDQFAQSEDFELYQKVLTKYKIK